MQMNRQRKHNTLGRYGDLGGDADAVSSEDANGLLHIPFRGLVRILQAKHSESASDLENHLAVHRQNHAVAVGREFRGACSSTEALAFELADPIQIFPWAYVECKSLHRPGRYCVINAR